MICAMTHAAQQTGFENLNTSQQLGPARRNLASHLHEGTRAVGTPSGSARLGAINPTLAVPALAGGVTESGLKPGLRTAGSRKGLTSWPGVCLVMVCLLGGCISRPPLSTRTFAFALPPASTREPSFESRRVLAIRSLRVAAPFDGRSFVYRPSEYSFESDPYAEFLVSSSESLLIPIRSWLRQSGTFGAVVEPGSARKPNTMAEISVLELYGDFQQPQEPAAVLTLRVLLFDAPHGVAGSTILEREYARRIPVRARTADAVMAGWNEALAQILAEFDADVRGLKPAPESL